MLIILICLTARVNIFDFGLCCRFITESKLIQNQTPCESICQILMRYWGIKMFIHSEDGHHFLGYRKSSFGKVQMVYDFEGTRRKVYDRETQDVLVVLFEFCNQKSDPVSSYSAYFISYIICSKYIVKRSRLSLKPKSCINPCVSGLNMCGK